MLPQVAHGSLRRSRHPPALARLRHPLTPSEAKVWRDVRNRQLGFKIRRQQPIARFILVSYCAEARLAIEIDGDVLADRLGVPVDLVMRDTLRPRLGQRILEEAVPV